MRDALGGTVVLVIIVVFIVIALGYMAFNVNYTKAFRMKNKVIAIYEDYEGQCNSGSECDTKIKDYANEIGYTLRDYKCQDGYEHRVVYCVKAIDVDRKKSISTIKHVKTEEGGSNELTDIPGQKYYSIETKINLDIPIISRAFDWEFFYITGDTKAFDIKN